MAACTHARPDLRLVPLLATPALADVAGIASVIDGDTIEVHGKLIRLHGIDAPESRQLCRLDGKPWQCGKDAANALADKIARRPVTCEDLGRDRYKRIIGRCAVAGEDLGAWMVSRGLALAYRRYSLDYADTEDDAQAARRGIWTSMDSGYYYQFLPPHEEAGTRTFLSVFIFSRQQAAPSATQDSGSSAMETGSPVDARNT